MKVKNAVNFIGSFEATLSAHAARQGADGIICGHIHHPTITTMNGITYVNIGDFVEACTAAVEHFDGRLEIVRWQAVAQTSIQEDEPEPLHQPGGRTVRTAA